MAARAAQPAAWERRAAPGGGEGVGEGDGVGDGGEGDGPLRGTRLPASRTTPLMIPSKSFAILTRSQPVGLCNAARQGVQEARWTRAHAARVAAGAAEARAAAILFFLFLPSKSRRARNMGSRSRRRTWGWRHRAAHEGEHAQHVCALVFTHSAAASSAIHTRLRPAVTWQHSCGVLVSVYLTGWPPSIRSPPCG